MPYASPAQQAEYQRLWVQRRREEWFEGKVCVDCGTGDDLQLDHVDPRKKVDHRIWSWSERRRAVELAKCVARCRPHHLEKSNGEKVRGAAHGQARATTEQVLEIRRRVGAGESQAAVGREMGFSRGYVNDIVRRKGRKYE
jgi:hypothetical protein